MGVTCTWPILVVVVLAWGVSFADEEALTSLCASGTPDLTQTDPKGNFAGGGVAFCGPVAVSNSLMTLFGEQLEEEGVTQYDLVNRLASYLYMGTHQVRGTKTNQLMRGVDKFLRERNEMGYSLKYQGWKSHDNEYRTKVNVPRLSWIAETLRGRGAVWLNVGWYRRDVEEGSYRFVGGHWVTAVGFEKDEKGEDNLSRLIIHDPAPRAGWWPSQEVVVMTRLESGRLVGTSHNLPRGAKGRYRMEGGMHIKRGVDLAILDGVVALRLSDLQSNEPDDRKRDPFR